MFVPSTREPQKIPGSQIARGIQVGWVVRDFRPPGGVSAESYLQKTLAKREPLM
jgi:hypothetical protein